MASERLGIELFVNGASKFARDIGYVNASLNRYERAIRSAQSTAQSQANAELRLAQSRVASANRTADAVISALKRQTDAETKYGAMVDKETATIAKNSKAKIKQWQDELVVRQNTLSALISSGAPQSDISRQATLVSNAAKKIIEWQGKQAAGVRTLTAHTQQLATAENNIMNLSAKKVAAIQNLKKSYEEEAAATKKAAMVQQEFSQATTGLSGFLGALTGDFGSNITFSGQFSQALAKAGLQSAALSLGLDILKIGIDSVTFAIKFVVGAFNLLWGIFSKVVGTVWEMASAIGQRLWGALKSLVSFPFSLIKRGFDAIGGSIQRILEIALGMNLDRIIWGISQAFRDLTGTVFSAATNFQLLGIQLQGLIARELVDTKKVDSFKEGLEAAVPISKELFDWITKLAITSPFSVEDVNQVMLLASSYGFTIQESKKLTQSIVEFGAGMGLQGDVVRRIIENFGQMRAAGKLTGTELRDLARGAFIPISKILTETGKKFNLTGAEVKKLGATGQNLGEVWDKYVNEALKNGTPIDQIEGLDKALSGLPVDEFIQAFERFVGKDFQGAAERTSTSWATATSNIQDFIQSVIGMRILKPVIDVVSGRLSKFITALFTPEILAIADRWGKIFATITETLFGFSDSLGSTSSAISNFTSIAGDWATGFELALGIIQPKVSGVVTRKNGFVDEDTIIFPDINETAIKVRDKVLKIIQTIKDTFALGVRFIKDPFGTIKNEILPELMTKFGEFKDFIINSVLPSLSDFATGALDIFNQNMPPVVDWITTKLIGGFQSLKDWVDQNAGPGSIFSSFLTVVQDVLNVANKAVNVAPAQSGERKEKGAGTNNALTQLGADMDVLKSKVQDLVNNGLNTISTWVSANAPGLSPLMDLIKNMSNANWGEIVSGFHAFVIDVVALGHAADSILLLAEGIAKIFKFIFGLTAIGKGLENVTKFFGSEKGANLAETFTKGFDQAVAQWSSGKGSILDTMFKDTDPFGTTGKSGTSIWSSLFSGLGDATAAGTQSSIDEWGLYNQNVIQKANELNDVMVAHSIVPDMMTAITESISTSLTNLVTITMPPLWEQFKNIFDINAMRLLGVGLLNGLYQGLVMQLPVVIGLIKDLNIEGQVRDAIGRLNFNITIGVNGASATPIKKSGGSCFIAGTMVNGRYGPVAIERLRIGDEVMTYDENDMFYEFQKIVDTITNIRNDLVTIKTKASSITCSPNHRFLVKYIAWVEAKDLVPGTILTNISGSDEEVVSVENYSGEHTVYNLTVAVTHTYLVNGYVVHNAKVAQKGKGGPISAGTPYVVGDKGPEIIVPKVPGTVIPNSRILSQLASMRLNPVSVGNTSIASRSVSYTNNNQNFYGNQYFQMQQGSSFKDLFRQA
jgi:tape measure domain-containing protein